MNSRRNWRTFSYTITGHFLVRVSSIFQILQFIAFRCETDFVMAGAVLQHHGPRQKYASCRSLVSIHNYMMHASCVLRFAGYSATKWHAMKIANISTSQISLVFCYASLQISNSAIFRVCIFVSIRLPGVLCMQQGTRIEFFLGFHDFEGIVWKRINCYEEGWLCTEQTWRSGKNRPTHPRKHAACFQRKWMSS